MLAQIGPGLRLPPVPLSRLNGESLEVLQTDDLFKGRRAVVVGVIGAFTPVCTEAHVPEFVQRASDLRELGFDMVVCTVPNDPWTVRAWSESIDPSGRVTFLSDGNLQLARRLGVTFERPELFVGERPRRYLLVLSDGILEHIAVEPTPTELTCTRAIDIAGQVAMRV